jgi:hypothetical protein
VTQPHAEPTPDGRDPQPEREFPTVMQQVGGVQGMLASVLPVVVFIVVNVLTSLQPALLAAIGAAVLVAAWRLLRKQALMPAVSGLFGVGICAFIAYQTGEARGFYLPGLLLNAALALAFLVSVLVRRPLAGVVWHGINGDGQAWRQNPRLRRTYTWVSLMWAAVFGARLVVQGWLYGVDEETWLGVARLVMGVPLVAVAVLVTVLAVRRAVRTPTQA